MSRKRVFAAAIAAGCVALSGLLVASPGRIARADTTELTQADIIADRGTILAIDAENRMIVVATHTRGTLAFGVMDGVRNFSSLKLKMAIEFKYYRIVDLLVAKTTPEVSARARAMVMDSNLAPTIAGTPWKARVWGAAGIATRVDQEQREVDVAQGAVIYTTPSVRSTEGTAALKTFEPGDKVTLVFTERTAFDFKPIE
jgi:hypothetical protein